MVEFPEAELIRQTFILRKMDLPPNIELTRRSLLRWFALSFGLISEKESRSTILDVLDALFCLKLADGLNPTTQDLLVYFKEKDKKISEKLLRYHLKRLIDSGFIERKRLRYFFAADPYAERDDLKAGFKHAISSTVNSSLNDLELVLDKIIANYR